METTNAQSQQGANSGGNEGKNPAQGFLKSFGNPVGQQGFGKSSAPAYTNENAQQQTQQQQQNQNQNGNGNGEEPEFLWDYTEDDDPNQSQQNIGGSHQNSNQNPGVENGNNNAHSGGNASQQQQQNQQNQQQQNQQNQQQQQQNNSGSEQGFHAFARELGLDIPATLKTPEEQFLALKAQIRELRTNAVQISAPQQVNDLKVLLQKPAEELVKTVYMDRGLDEADAKAAVDTAKANGTLGTEEKLMRAAIQKAITKLSEQHTNQIIQQQDSEKASQRKLREDQIAELEKLDKFLGGKISKPETKVGARALLESGKIDDLMKDPKARAEFAFYFANKEVLTKALKTQQMEDGKKAVFQKLEHGSRRNPSRQSAEGGNGAAFNPTNFIKGLQIDTGKVVTGAEFLSKKS